LDPGNLLEFQQLVVAVSANWLPGSCRVRQMVAWGRCQGPLAIGMSIGTVGPNAIPSSWEVQPHRWWHERNDACLQSQAATWHPGHRLMCAKLMTCM